jgi:AcrR family transcriptional regulator
MVSTPSRTDGRSSDRRGTARERVLDAAAKVFASRGYHAATVDEIVQAADLTKGALYAHFSSKQELFIQLLEERIDRPVRALLQITETAGAQASTAGAIGSGLATLLDQERDAVLLIFEFWAIAVREPEHAKRYEAWLASLTSALARALEARHQVTGVPLSFDSRLLASGVIGLAHGLAMRQLATGGRPGIELMGDMLDLLYDGLVQRAASSGPAA